jgi:hypothetical protein
VRGSVPVTTVTEGMDCWLASDPREGKVVTTVASTCVKEEFLSLDVLKTIMLLYLVKVCMPSVL